jgi:hypothetical protein
MAESAEAPATFEGKELIDHKKVQKSCPELGKLKENPVTIRTPLSAPITLPFSPPRSIVKRQKRLPRKQRPSLIGSVGRCFCE